MQQGLDIHTRLPMLSVIAVCAIAATALAVAMGIGRFALTPLLPLMARDGALSLSGGAWLAAGNYLGYLSGALITARLSIPPPMLMRVSLAGIAATTAAMGMFDGLAAWISLRFAAGVLSAWALVSISTWALRHLSEARRTELSGLVYAGVGLGIALTGLFALLTVQPSVSAGRMWLELGALAALVAAVLSILIGRSSDAASEADPAPPANGVHRSHAGLVICYGVLGFGYVLPATFLPALAREVIDDPRWFGLAWPAFGIAAALSTIATGRISAHAHRLRIWAASHLIMAAGVILPSLWLAPVTIGIAALTVGSTFMVATMIGLQEARMRAPSNPTMLIGAMTAAFAIGQLAGPLVSGSIDLLPVGHHAALGYALQLAAFLLAVTAIHLWRQSR